MKVCSYIMQEVITKGRSWSLSTFKTQGSISNLPPRQKYQFVGNFFTGVRGFWHTPFVCFSSLAQLCKALTKPRNISVWSLGWQWLHYGKYRSIITSMDFCITVYHGYYTTDETCTCWELSTVAHPDSSNSSNSSIFLLQEQSLFTSHSLWWR